MPFAASSAQYSLKEDSLVFRYASWSELKGPGVAICGVWVSAPSIDEGEEGGADIEKADDATRHQLPKYRGLDTMDL